MGVTKKWALTLEDEQFQSLPPEEKVYLIDLNMKVKYYSDAEFDYKAYHAEQKQLQDKYNRENGK